MFCITTFLRLATGNQIAAMSTLTLRVDSSTELSFLLKTFDQRIIFRHDSLICDCSEGRNKFGPCFAGSAESVESVTIARGACNRKRERQLRKRVVVSCKRHR